MAEYQTPEEFERQLERLAEQLEKGWITAKEYNDAKKDAIIGIRGYTAELKAAQQKLGMSALALGKDMMSGKQGVSVFGDMAESGADAVAAYTKKFGPAGQALGLFTQAVAKFALASLKQSDVLFESFQKISRTGTVGAGAMTEVFENMLKFGYTVDQLGNLGDLLARNSKDFGMFFSSALKGSRAFAEVADQVQNSGLRQQLFNLGLTVDDINDGIAGYINQQGKLGQVQGRTTDQLRMGAEAYIKELDILTKLTGMTRKEQEDAREQALQVREFYAGLQDLGPEAQEQALQAYSMAFAKGGPKLAAEMASQFNGFITGASDLFLTTGGASMQAFSKEFFARGGTAAQSFQMLRDSITPEVIQITKGLNQFGAGLGVDLRPLMMLTQNSDNLQKSLDQLTDEQYKMLTGTDRATAAQSKVRDNQIKTAQNLQEFVQIGVAPATQALTFFTEALEYLTSFIPGAGAAKKKREEEKAIREGRTTTTMQMNEAGRSAAGMLNFGGGAELTPEEQKRFGVGPTGAPTGEGLAGKPLSGVSPALASALQMAAAEYYQLTGRKVEVTSAVRDSAKQAQLYQDYIEGRSPFPAAPPGTSKHEAGLAVDVSKNVADELDRMGLLQKYGLARPVRNDPVHIEASAEMGGILSGPKSGYKAMLHGTEAVVPLPDGRTIPVEVRNQDSGSVSAQLDKLDELIRIMQNQVNVSTKILQASQ